MPEVAVRPQRAAFRGLTGRRDRSLLGDAGRHARRRPFASGDGGFLVPEAVSNFAL